jgi:hypothetical protein
MIMTTKKTKILICTIDRATWARGNKNVPAEKGPDFEKNHLLNNTGSRCCLGFLGKCVGVSDEVLLNTALPSSLPIEDRDKYPTLEHNRYCWEDFSALNDNPTITEAEREQQLRDKAQANGFRFRFVGPKE